MPSFEALGSDWVPQASGPGPGPAFGAARGGEAAWPGRGKLSPDVPLEEELL